MKSDDLISRSAFDEVLDKLEGLKAHAAFTEGIMVVRRELEQFPTVDAESVRHGKYGFVGMDMMAGSRAFYFGTCSECHERINFEAKHKNYCPNCGAKMDAEVNNDGSNSAEY